MSNPSNTPPSPEPADPDGAMVARTKQLAKDLLDALDEPKSEGRIAAEARKEREDAEALERFYRATGQRQRTYADAAGDLAHVIETLPSEGAFEAVELPLMGPHGRKAVLRFAPSPSKPREKRYVELSVFTPSGISSSSQWLESGSNAKLVAYLRAAGTPAGMETIAGELVESLARSRLA